MTKLQSVLSEFDAIAETNSVIVKTNMLGSLSPLAKQVMVYALDPYRMFGVKKFDMHRPIVFPENVIDDPSKLFETLDALQQRKVTGGRAVTECEFLTEKYAVPSELLSRILNKDLRCGVGSTLANKVYPGLIPEFKVALAREYEEDEDWPKMWSIKYDGLRCLAMIDETGVTLKTRNGLPITSADHVIEALLSVWNPIDYYPLVFDGELKEATGHFQDSSGSVRKKKKQSGSLVFHIFDVIPLSDFLVKKSGITQEERIKFLDLFKAKHWIPSVPWTVVDHPMAWSHSEVMIQYRAAREKKEEGLILKKPRAFYQYKRSDAWTKLKDVKTVDLKVVGIEPGKGKYEGLVGALVVDFQGQQNRVGSGLSDYQRKLWTDNPNLILHHMVEVAYHELTKDGNMRHSRLIRTRPDLE